MVNISVFSFSDYNKLSSNKLTDDDELERMELKVKEKEELINDLEKRNDEVRNVATCAVLSLCMSCSLVTKKSEDA